MQQLPPTIHESWHKHLQPLFEDPKMVMIKDQILPQALYFPEKKDIFRVFKMPLNEIKVVVLGQDPYPNGEGIGLAFAVNCAVNMPPSLQIIKRETEIRDTLWYFKKYEDVMWKTLEHWEKQGVFLLNTALTVESGIAGSHLGYWMWFTKEVIKIIAVNTPCIWLLWGAKAKGYKDYISAFSNYIQFDNVNPVIEEVVTTGNPKAENYILTADHPAAETYPGSKYKFTGCNHFNLTNRILAAKGQSLIKW